MMLEEGRQSPFWKLLAKHDVDLYLVVKVSPKTLELELKELDIVNKGKKLWQEGQNRPRETVVITDEIRKRGYVSVGRMVIDKTTDQKVAKDKSGYFDETNNPKDRDLISRLSGSGGGLAASALGSHTH